MSAAEEAQQWQLRMASLTGALTARAWVLALLAREYPALAADAAAVAETVEAIRAHNAEVLPFQRAARVDSTICPCDADMECSQHPKGETR